MKSRLEWITGGPLDTTPAVSTIEELLTGPGLFEMFSDACEADRRQAQSCAGIKPSRSNPNPKPTGRQRFIIYDELVRAQYASHLRYRLVMGSLCFDIFMQVIRCMMDTLGVMVSLEFEGARVSAYTFSFD
jgi:hypothetical protein